MCTTIPKFVEPRVLPISHRRCEERVRERRGNLASSTSRTPHEIATPRRSVARDDGWEVSLRRLFHDPGFLCRQAVQFVHQLTDLPAQGPLVMRLLRGRPLPTGPLPIMPELDPQPN
jgi:hypothetical protein